MCKSNKLEYLSLFFALILPLNDVISCVHNFNRIKLSDAKFLFKQEYSQAPRLKKQNDDLNKYTQEVEQQQNSELEYLTVSSSTQSSGGDGQVSGFTVSSTDGLVDKFSGDFNYSIPLVDVEGYPITLSYNSNVGMHSDASWVGLGWELSVGAVNREMRGIPDEFNGFQTVKRSYSQKDDQTTNGFKIGATAKIVPYIGDAESPKSSGSLSGTLLLGSYKNNYLGKSNTLDLGVQASLSIGEKIFLGPKFGVGYSRDSKRGIGVSSSIGLSGGLNNQTLGLEGDVDWSKSFHSRNGLYSKSFGYNLSGLHKSKLGLGAGFGTETYVSYGSQTSIPRIQFDEEGKSNSAIVSLQYGQLVPAIFMTVFGGLQTNFNNSSSGLANKVIETPAIGYLHYGKAENFSENKVLFDYNRGSDYKLSENSHNLSFSVLTSDFFHASASGISGTFRANRTDVGSIVNEKNNSTSTGNNNMTGVSFVNKEATNILLASYQYGNLKSDGESGNWDINNSNVVSYLPEESSTKFDNSCYFKKIGENTPNNTELWDAFGGNSAKSLKITKVGDDFTTNYGLVSNQSNQPAITINPSTINTIQSKPIIATFFKAITVEELQNSEPNFISYGINQFPISIATQTPIARLTDSRHLNHISKIQILDESGMNYEYGIPVYTYSQSEVSFSTDQQYSNVNNAGLVSYIGAGNGYNGDNSLANDKGLFNFFDKTTVPSYAHSFLLTKILSSDYKDMTGDGLTSDDVGNYYKFNYSQVFGDESGYALRFKSRFPMSNLPNQAFFNRGFNSLTDDNIASYTYSEKEIWCLNSIETKNLVAEFSLRERNDAYGATNENGGVYSQYLTTKALGKIEVYNKSMRNDSKESSANATPLITIEFVYDHSLCKNVPSNKYSQQGSVSNDPGTGKLTLKEVIISTGRSDERKIQRIKFEYSSVNPNFNYSNVDTWGNFKQNNPTSPNDINPYVKQNQVELNNSCKAWKLVKISNTLGGEIEIDYEPDSYKSVQNKGAMRHFDIYRMTNVFHLQHLRSLQSWNGTSHVSTNFTEDFSSNGLRNFLTQSAGMNTTQANLFVSISTDTESSSLSGIKYTQKYGKFIPKHTPNNVIIFKLEEPILGNLDQNTADNVIKNKYFKDIINEQFLKTLYFRSHVKIKSTETYTELIPMMAGIMDDMPDMFNNLTSFQDDLKSIGVMPKSPSGNYEYGYVVLEPVLTSVGEDDEGADSGDDEAMTIHPLQKFALDFARRNLVSIVYGSCDGCETDNDLDAVAWKNQNINKTMIEKGYAPHLVYDYSTIRLYEPDNIKLASSARVKSIKYKDNWSRISDEEGDQIISGESNGEYIWTYDYSDRSVSTGVASFEPRSIIDENPFYEWKTFFDVKKKFPDETNYNVAPVAELFYPNPSIGYSQVSVSFVGTSSYGSYITNYYTAADFPTISEETRMSKETIKKYNRITGNSSEFFALSQGYFVMTNDFHGKLKSVSLLDKMSNVISRTTYNYFLPFDIMKFIDRNGSIQSSNSLTSGSEFDIHFDNRFIEESTRIYSFGMMGGVTFPLPALIVLPIGFYSYRNKGFYSSSLVKHLNYSAKVKSVTTENFSSKNTAENLYFDRHSGDVLISKLIDEFNDNLYSFNFPSHWYHEQFRNILYKPISVQGNISSNGQFVYVGTENLKDYFVPGDLVRIGPPSSNNIATILKINTQSTSGQITNTIFLINTLTGDIISTLNGQFSISLLQSNRKNRLTESMQSIVSKVAPITTDGNSIYFHNSNILSSNAVSYDEKLNLKCVNPGTTPNPNSRDVAIGSTLNPFTLGIKGDLFVDAQYSWQGERKQNQHAHGIRFDGEYDSFTIPFYFLGSDFRWNRVIDQTFIPHLWRTSGDVLRFDQFGNAIEGIDPIKVKSSVLFGYNPNLKLLPIAQATNASVSDIAYDGFEDYDYFSSNLYKETESHLNFSSFVTSGQATIDDIVRHSGLSSLKMTNSGFIQITKDVNTSTPCSGSLDPSLSNGKFNATECVCIPPFKPSPGKYIVSAWVRDVLNQNSENFVNPKINISFTGSAQGYSFLSSGNIIDGWQRIFGEFDIPVGATKITINFQNMGGGAVYFDDFRIHPFLSSMSTTVYDKATLLPIAVHDENNFTVFYNYDENLNQVRTRIETIEGIKTISETEVGLKKN